MREQLPLLISAAVVIGVWFLLRVRGSKLDSAASLDEKIGKGRPVVLEFFSNL